MHCETNKLWIGVLCGSAILFFCSDVRAADRPVIQFDPVAEAFSTLLPYRVSFTLDIPAPKNATSVVATFWETKPNTTDCKTVEPGAHRLAGMAQPTLPDATDKRFRIEMPALHALSGYCISIETAMPWSAEENARVVAVVTAGVAKLAAKGVVTLAELTEGIANSLGTDADAPLRNRTGTVKDQIRNALWGEKKAPALAALEKAALEYHNARTNLVMYYNLLKEFESTTKDRGGATEKAVKEATAQLESAKLDKDEKTAEPTTAVTAPVVNAMKDVERKRGGLKGRDCGKIAEARTKIDCQTDQKVFGKNPEIVASGVEYLDSVVTRASDFAAAKKELSTEIGLLVDTFVVSTAKIPVAAANPSYTEAAPFYISGDVGVSVPLFINPSHSYGADFQPYVAVSMSFIPVDKDVPLAKEGGFLRRFSVLGGFTLAQTKNSDGSIVGVFGGRGILAGVGLRLTDYVRLGAGAVFLRQNDTNKLISDTHIRVAPYLSLSIDLDVAGVVTGIFSTGAGLHI